MTPRAVISNVRVGPLVQCGLLAAQGGGFLNGLWDIQDELRPVTDIWNIGTVMWNNGTRLRRLQQRRIVQLLRIHRHFSFSATSFTLRAGRAP
jgi:hypothetical protein